METFFSYASLSYGMTPPEDKVRVIARISKSLYDSICQRYDTIAQAIANSLELLISHDDTNVHPDDIHAHTQVQADIQELTARLEEKEKVIAIFQGELENVKAMHNNYFLQVQTLINQKSIEAPGNKKKWWKVW